MSAQKQSCQDPADSEEPPDDVLCVVLAPMAPHPLLFNQVILHSILSLGVTDCERLFISVCPLIGWQPVQGVPRLWPQDSCHWLQHSPHPCEDKRLGKLIYSKFLKK